MSSPAKRALPKPYPQAKRDLLPYSAIVGYTRDYEEPTLGEGFSEIKTINWVFEGDAEARTRWSMWLQLDGGLACIWFGIPTLMGFQTTSIRNNASTVDWRQCQCTTEIHSSSFFRPLKSFVVLSTCSTTWYKKWIKMTYSTRMPKTSNTSIRDSSSPPWLLCTNICSNLEYWAGNA